MERIPLACSNPFYKYNKLTHTYNKIPCGWCLRCRIDRRNYFADKFEYAYFKDFNSVGTFLCVTYDDNHIPMNSDCSSYTLRKSDCVNFIKRLRSYINYHKLTYNPFVRSDFKYICAGEYGDEMFRPHLHFIIVGLDYLACQDIYLKCWKNGVIIDSKPILNGGIRYVCKYLDKQQHGDQLDQYLDMDIEPPFFLSSHNLAHGLYDTPDDFYIWNNKKRPLPVWIKNRRLIPNKSLISDKVYNFAKSNSMTYDDASYYLRSAELNEFEHNSFRNNEPFERVESLSKTNIALEFRNRLAVNSVQ